MRIAPVYGFLLWTVVCAVATVHYAAAAEKVRVPIGEYVDSRTESGCAKPGPPGSSSG